MLSYRVHVVLNAMGAAWLLFAASVPLFSQGSEGRISGTVTDQSGAAIPGARVTITDEQRNDSRSVTTDSAGAYAAPNLIPSTYDVHIEFQGFKGADRKDLALEE